MICAYETAAGKQHYMDSVMDCECNISLTVCSLKMSHTVPTVAKATISTMGAWSYLGWTVCYLG